MGHDVTGLIAKKEVLQSLAHKYSLHQPTDLPQGFSILPLRDDDLDKILKPPLSQSLSGFVYLCPELMGLLARESKYGALVYFETGYFGGMGAQAAAVFVDGSLAREPESADLGPINRALALLGVKADQPQQDEFEALELGRHRSTRKWIG